MTHTAGPLGLTEWPAGRGHVVRLGGEATVCRTPDGGYEVAAAGGRMRVAESQLGELVGPPEAVRWVNVAWMHVDMGDVPGWPADGGD